ncbi:MAG: hypothetical protein K2X66_11190, partial [Cyanobacteria bacterium]|nr:hypothetical protein [Cyanobacteriota bacterium]
MIQFRTSYAFKPFPPSSTFNRTTHNLKPSFISFGGNLSETLALFQSDVGNVFKAQGKTPEAPLHQVLGPYKAAMAEITQGMATGELLIQQVRPVVQRFYQGLVDLGLVS